MKTQHYHQTLLAMTVACVAFTFVGFTSSFADGRYRHDGNGYWDNSHRYHQYEFYHNHRGYWDQRNGVRIFITI